MSRADILMAIAKNITNQYHEDMFTKETEEKYPKILSQVIEHEAFCWFSVDDLN